MPHTFRLYDSGLAAGSQKGSSSFLWGGSRETKPKVSNKGGVRKRGDNHPIQWGVSRGQKTLLRPVTGDDEEEEAGSGRVSSLGNW